MLETLPERIEIVDLASHEGDLADLDLVIYDLTGLQASGDEDLRRLVGANAAVLGLTDDRRADLGELAQRLGVRSVVPMSLTADELIGAVQATVRGQVAPDVALRRASDADPRLSDRELEVLACVAEGLSNAEIARRLYLSVNTVKSYIRTGYRKIGATRRSQAVGWYLGAGRLDTSGPPD